MRCRLDDFFRSNISILREEKSFKANRFSVIKKEAQVYCLRFQKYYFNILFGLRSALSGAIDHLVADFDNGSRTSHSQHAKHCEHDDTAVAGLHIFAA
ncbi:MAG: hypothetical protein KBS45_03395, partial [Clostridiales bacterium]|nr:hypothetical protein [Candidatus Coliplasma caballi]